MSHSNPPSYHYELVDADATILDPDASIGHNDDRPMQSANAPPNHHQFQPPPPPPPPLLPPHPTLPTGQIIDGKNTLQSFDRFVRNDVAAINTNATTGEEEARATRAAALATTHDSTTHPMAAITATAATTHPPDPQLYTLPTGEITNAKNINQSYDAMVQHNDNYNGNNNNNKNKNSVTPPTNLGTENVIIHSSNNPSDTAVPLRVTTNNTDQDHGSGNNNNNMPTVHAFAVESQIVVEAEPISMLLQPQPQPQPPLQQQRSLTFWIINSFVIATLVAAASLGVYCGTGNCKSNGGGAAMSSPNSDTNPTSLPIVNSTVDGMEELSVTLLKFIQNITLSDESITVNGTNAESMALTWMLDNDDCLDDIEFIDQ
jgi:hypothetical protein